MLARADRGRHQQQQAVGARGGMCTVQSAVDAMVQVLVRQPDSLEFAEDLVSKATKRLHTYSQMVLGPRAGSIRVPFILSSTRAV